MERARLTDDASELAAIVRAAQKGDEASLARLVEYTQKRLFRFLLFLAADRNLANDLCQDTFLYVFENLSRVTDPQAFWRWLFLVARNKFLDHRKSPRNKTHLPVEALERPDAAGDPEKRELVVQVREAFGHLEPDERMVLLLIDLEGYSVAEAAGIIGVSDSAAQSRLRRARAAFHKRYFR